MSNTPGHKIATVFLGEMPASTYERLPARMQAACRQMVRNGEMVIENMTEGTR